MIGVPVAGDILKWENDPPLWYFLVTNVCELKGNVYSVDLLCLFNGEKAHDMVTENCQWITKVA